MPSLFADPNEAALPQPEASEPIAAIPASSSHTSQHDLIELLTQNTPIQDGVLSNLEIRDVLSLTKTTKAFSDLYKIVERTQFDIDKALGYLFKSPLKFRSLQAEHNVIIGGIFALEFMARGVLERKVKFQGISLRWSSQRTLYVQEGEHAEALSKLLLDEGYALSDEMTANHGGMHNVYATQVDAAGREKEIGISVMSCTPLFALFRFSLPKTAGFNFITWNRAYCVFPYQTFIEKVAYPFGHIGRATVASQALRKLDDLGFEVGLLSLKDQFPSKCAEARRDSLKLGVEADGASRASSKSAMLGGRRMGDNRSWIIPLRTNGVKSSAFPSHFVDYAGFTIGKEINLYRTLDEGDKPTFTHYTIETQLVQEHSLRFSYILPAAEKEMRHFRDRTILALYLLDPKHWPTNFTPDQVFASGAHRNRDPDLEQLETWSPPADSGWKYHDDEMLELLKKRYPDMSQ